MKKEKILLSNIIQDLKIVADFQISNTADRRLVYIIPATLLSVILGFLSKNFWIALAIFTVAAYHIVRYAIEYKDYRAQKKSINDVLERGDVSVSVEQLNSISEELIYEPHRNLTNTKLARATTFYYFASGKSWRVPNVLKHYKWSMEYYVSTEGLKNISIEGDEFYFVSLQGNHNIAYIYPCKNFELEESLRKNI